MTPPIKPNNHRDINLSTPHKIALSHIHTRSRTYICSYSYKIMCPKLLVGVEKDKKATEIIVKHIDLPEDQYRLGNTKVP